MDGSPREIIEAILETLPPQSREVFLLRLQSDLTYSDVAEVMGLPVSTVRTIYARVVALIRVRLEAEGVIFENLGHLWARPALPTSSLRVAVAPGRAPDEEIAEILARLSMLYRMMGGAGIEFELEGVETAPAVADAK